MRFFMVLLALCMAVPAQAQMNTRPHHGSRPRDLAIAISVVPVAQDTVTVSATWISRNNFEERFLWRVDVLTLTGDTELLTVSFPVEQTIQDVSAVFCVKAQRVSDGRESTEVCQAFVIPAADIVLPPDSLKVQVASIGPDYMTARWDTLSNVAEYFVSIETPTGMVGSFPFAYIRRMLTV